MLVSFPSWWQNTPEKQLKRERFILAQSFNILVHGGCLHCYGPVVKQRILATKTWWDSLLTLWYLGRRESGAGDGDEKDRDRDRCLRQNTLFEDTSASQLLLPTRPHLLKFPPSPNSAISWGSSILHMRLWEAFQMKNIT